MNRRLNELKRGDKPSPYLNIEGILAAAGAVIMGALFLMIILAAFIVALLGAFIILKVVGVVTFGWGWVFSPAWIPMLFIFGIGIAVFAAGYIINVGIFVGRLVTGKLGC